MKIDVVCGPAPERTGRRRNRHHRRHGPDRVVYVSCDPGTLARDVKLFAAQGYALRKAEAVDLFPRTAPRGDRLSPDSDEIESASRANENNRKVLSTSTWKLSSICVT